MITIKAILIDELNIKYLTIRTSKDNYILHKKKLESERIKIINRLREYEKAGLIRNIFKPRNKKMQKHLNELVFAKKIIKNSIQQIKSYFQ
jgi:hypothetical protein